MGDNRQTAPGLRHVSDEMPGIRRRRSGKGFVYLDPEGKRIAEKGTLARMRRLAIPPAYEDVWICPDPDGHIQATGRDARGRKQYRYHPCFREMQEANKYEHILDFVRVLPRVRARVDADMRLPGLPREKVLATVVHLLERTMIRVGNKDYARANGSFGLTTLKDGHVAVEGGAIRFRFRGKSGKEWRLKVDDRRIARIVKACQDLPGQHLFRYEDADGILHDVGSGDVNAYLREVSGGDVTAKDFRTWSGTVLAAVALQELEAADGQAAARRNIRAAIERVAARLGNTPSVCRKCYVHPEIIAGYLDRSLALEAYEEIAAELRGDLSGLKAEEALVLAFLQRRLAARTQGAADRDGGRRPLRAGLPP